MLIIDPLLCLSIGLKQAFVRLNTEFILTFITALKSSSLILIRRLSFVIPALLTSTSIEPKSFITFSAKEDESSKSDASET